jgi:pyruvate dehydrogenase complex dehydrogenase (E1) component
MGANLSDCLRAFLEGRLSEEKLLSFRQETGGKGTAS